MLHDYIHIIHVAGAIDQTYCTFRANANLILDNKPANVHPISVITSSVLVLMPAAAYPGSKIPETETQPE